MLVVPWAYDQPDQAARLVRIGVARTVSRHRYTAARAVRQLDPLLHNAQYAVRCQETAEQVRAENGLGIACDALEASMRLRCFRSIDEG